MQGLVALAVLVVLLVVALVVTQPLRARHRTTEREDELADRRSELETAKEAKYREIRDAELDHATGKLDDADWRAVDRQLRAEAVQLLRRIDALGEEATGPDRAPAAEPGAAPPPAGADPPPR